MIGGIWTDCFRNGSGGYCLKTRSGESPYGEREIRCCCSTPHTGVNEVSDNDMIKTYIPVVFVQNPGHLGGDEGRMAS